MPRPTLGSAVADTEDPAVAGQQLAPRRALPSGRPRARTPSSRRRDAGSCSRSAHGDAHRPVVALLPKPMASASRAETPSAATTTGARNSVSSPVRRPLSSTVRARTPTARPVASSRTGPVTAVRSCRRAPTFCAWLVKDLVESYPGAHEAVVGGTTTVPASADRDGAHRRRSAARGCGSSPGSVDVDAHRGQLVDRARGQPVAADLVAGERGLVEEEDVRPGLASR